MFQVHYPGCAYYGTNENEDTCLCAVIRSLLSNKRRNGIGRGTINELEKTIEVIQNDITRIESNIDKIEKDYPITIDDTESTDIKCISQGGNKIEYGDIYNPSADNCSGFKVVISDSNKIYRIKINGITYLKEPTVNDFNKPTRIVEYNSENADNYEGKWL